MKNLIEFPPNYNEILAKFPAVKGKPVVFAYGDILYNPTGAEISSDLRVHEETHSQQQKDFRGSVEMWWKEYLSNPEFRLDQEAKAYRAQYIFYMKENGGQKSRGRQVRRTFLHKISTDLSSSLYGKICSYDYARKLIGNYD